MLPRTPFDRGLLAFAGGLLFLAAALPGCAPIMAQARYGRETEAAAVRNQTSADVLLLMRMGCTLTGLQGALEAQGVDRGEATKRATTAWTLGAGVCPGARKE